MQPAQYRGHCPGLVFACVYKEWFRFHDDNPNIEFRHFFANPVQIASTGPNTVNGILQAQKSFYNQASSLLSNLSRGELSNGLLLAEPSKV
jgi:hypothetical protein